MNAIVPNSVPKINSGKYKNLFSFFKIEINLGENGFKLMENISRFAQAARTYGLSDSETFQTVDLYEKMNLHQVILCLFALGRKVN
jgi:hypothetical protein